MSSVLCTAFLALLLSFSTVVTSDEEFSGYGFEPNVFAFTAWKNPCSSTTVSSKPFCDETKSFEDRAHDLVYVQEAGLSDANTVYQGLSGNGAKGVSALNIGGYQWWSEALHGVANSPGVNYNGPIKHTTMFPQVITTGATFNRSLMHTIGQHIAIEARAMFNNGQAGLTFWAPNINIFRDPRWGRGQETPGEDPFLNSVYAGEFVSGMQGDLSTQKYIKASSCCKHYADYSMENADGHSRHNFDAITTATDQNETYLVAFKYCAVAGNTSGVMCSYNAETVSGQYNNVPSCANWDLMTRDLRNAWGFQGYITSDCGAVNDVQNSHHYTSTTGATVNATFAAGMDLDCGSFTQQHTAAAISSGAVKLATVQASLYRATLVQMRLGLFDAPANVPWSNLGPRDVCTPAALAIAYEAAQQGMVLLKNMKNTLPLSTTTYKSVALIGPNANNAGVMEGNYHGNAPFVLTVRQGLANYSSSVNYQQGCAMSSSDTSGFAAAISAAKAADVTIMVMGLDESQEAEGHDRTSIAVPGKQNDLIGQVSAASKGPVILVILSGGCVDIGQWRDSSAIDAIIWGGYPGMYGGLAVADVIYGGFAPSGRLDQTWYLSSYTSQVEMVNMDMHPTTTKGPYGTSPGRGYRYFPGPVVYYFGAGLSYTTFSCTTLAVSGNRLSTNVKNTGSVDSGGVAIVYWVPTNAGQNGAEIKRMVGFGRVDALRAGTTQALMMDMYPEFYGSAEQMAGDGKYVLDGICA
jgi:beta-glucosidase-like glycosyl hydrolase